VVSAAGYTSVVFALLFGFLFWSELPDALALLGGVIIVGAGIFLTHARRGVYVPPAGH
jgi:drug/metabolite transporter (DMT)-like permease